MVTSALSELAITVMYTLSVTVLSYTTFLFSLELITILSSFAWFFYILCTLIHPKLSTNCLKQWFLKYGPWPPGGPWDSFRELRGQSYFHNNTKAFFVLFHVLTFTLAEQKHWWGEVPPPWHESGNSKTVSGADSSPPRSQEQKS